MQRWHSYFQQHTRVFHNIAPHDTSDCPETVVSIVDTKHAAILSASQKYRRAISVTNVVASLAAECGMREFNDRVRILKDIERLWKAGKQCTVAELVADQPSDNHQSVTSDTLLFTSVYINTACTKTAL